jgi:ribonucleotide monophosphatase NagD (HAD superfamily)
VADHLQKLGILATPDDVVTSAQAVARLMATRFPAGSPVLVAGTPALMAEIRAVGLTPVPSSKDHPVAVVVGFAPDLRWSDFNDACFAVQAGAVWYGCNPDRTRPQVEGQAIGLGAMLDAMRVTMPDLEPILAGKPRRPLLDETLRRLGASHPIFVGDRLDTDIEGAHVVGIDSLFVLSGSHGSDDLLAAPPDQRPTYLAADIAGLLQPPVGTGDGPLDDLWRSAALAWADADRLRGTVQEAQPL